MSQRHLSSRVFQKAYLLQQCILQVVLKNTYGAKVVSKNICAKAMYWTISMMKLQECIPRFAAFHTSCHTLFSTWKTTKHHSLKISGSCLLCEKIVVRKFQAMMVRSSFAKSNRSGDFETPRPGYTFLQFHHRIEVFSGSL